MTGTGADRAFYRRVYREDEDPWTEMTYLDRRTESLLDRYLADCPEGSALDLGCGRGRLTQLCAQKLGWALGLDYLEEPLRDARRLHGHPRAVYLRADAFRLPLEGSRFDLVLDYGLLHHVRPSDLSAYRRAILGVLRPGGFYLGNVFHVDDRHADRGDRDWVYHRNHYDRFFTLDTLRSTLGDDVEVVDHRRFEDGEHVFLNVLMRRGES